MDWITSVDTNIVSCAGGTRVGLITFYVSLSVNYSVLKPHISELTKSIAKELNVDISQVDQIRTLEIYNCDIHTYLYTYFELINEMRYSSFAHAVEAVFTSLLYYIGGWWFILNNCRSTCWTLLPKEMILLLNGPFFQQGLLIIFLIQLQQ